MKWLLKTVFFSEIKRAVQKPYPIAKDTYEYVMRTHGYDLELLKEELERLNVEKENHCNKIEPKPKANEIVVNEEKIAQLSLFNWGVL